MWLCICCHVHFPFYTHQSDFKQAFLFSLKTFFKQETKLCVFIKFNNKVLNSVRSKIKLFRVAHTKKSETMTWFAIEIKGLKTVWRIKSNYNSN